MRLSDTLYTPAADSDALAKALLRGAPAAELQMELQVAVCVAACGVVCCSVLQCALHALAQVLLRGVPTAELQDGAAGCSMCFSVL